MATTKIERLMNLVICLLSTEHFLTADKIRTLVAGYGESSSVEAFNRMFERDKNELRDLGIPLETGRHRGSEVDGYRINRSAYELPAIDLDRDESAAVTMAAALWDDPSMASVARTALLKLRAGGVELVADSDLTVGVRAATPRAMGSEAVVAVLLRAVENQLPVSFLHRPSPTAEPSTRRLEPWGVVTHRGRWYVVGHDLDRGETRTFRLSRILEPVETGTASFTRPDDVDVRALVAEAATFADSGGHGPARIWVADGRAAGVRRAAATVAPEDRDGRPGAVVTLMEWSAESLARQVVGLGEDAVALAPPVLVDAVVAGLRGALAGADA
ncbi:WYL domain-containing protein [uncultured Williamsia sp.]|uniref:helix-turn-helix transcriptional regulator n=1 Tax=uncultured Williamsia sp. TaxID=259311 RepID=UPI002629F66D|nr:WYL domain-containing protein [uncultured Williamsia sp.]